MCDLMFILPQSHRVASGLAIVLGVGGLTLGACSLSSPSADPTSNTSDQSESSQSESSLPDGAAGRDAATSTTSPPSVIGTSIQALPDDTNYRFCSEPLSSVAALEQGELLSDPAATGLCFAFRKEGDRVVGVYYDTATLGEMGLCLSGVASRDMVLGKGREFIGSVGRQTLIEGSMGSELVNWDEPGFLKIAQAEIVNQSDTSGSEVHYNSLTLDLADFYRYPNSEVSNDCPDLQTE